MLATYGIDRISNIGRWAVFRAADAIGRSHCSFTILHMGYQCSMLSAELYSSAAPFGHCRGQYRTIIIYFSRVSAYTVANKMPFREAEYFAGELGFHICTRRGHAAATGADTGAFAAPFHYLSA